MPKHIRKRLLSSHPGKVRPPREPERRRRRWLSIGEVVEAFGGTPAYWLSHVHAGRLTGVRRGTAVFVSEASLKAYVKTVFSSLAQARAKTMQPAQSLPPVGAAVDSAGISRTAGVCGGEPRIAHTRIPVWTLEQSRRLGLTEAQILDTYPSLSAPDLVHAWEYAEAHPDEIERGITENEEA